MELQGENYSSVSNAALNIEPLEAPPAPDLQQIDEDLTNMSKVNMSRKKRKLYEAMKVVFLFVLFLAFTWLSLNNDNFKRIGIYVINRLQLKDFVGSFQFFCNVTLC